MSTGPTILEWGDPIPPPSEGLSGLLDLLIEGTRAKRLRWHPVETEYRFGPYRRWRQPLGSILLKLEEISLPDDRKCEIYLCVMNGASNANLIIDPLNGGIHSHAIPGDDERLSDLISAIGGGYSLTSDDTSIDLAIECVNEVLGR